MALLLLSLLGCIDERDCTAIAVSSTTVTVVDADGGAIEGATLTYVLDGEGPQPCQELRPGEYVCGTEASGHFVITAEKTGWADATAEVDVGTDACHPIPEAVTIVMESVDCTDVEVPSVLVTLTGSGGEELSNPQVSYVFGDTAASIACDTGDGVTWTCGNDEWGDFHVTGSADGHEAETVDVIVLPDEYVCHPVTEEITIALEWLPD